MWVSKDLHNTAVRLAAVSETPRLDAEILLAHALGVSRSRLLMTLREEVDTAGLEGLVARRLNYEPIAYITGSWEFFSLEFACRAPMLVPRPETEHLVEVALNHLKAMPGPVLDLCTGTGCVAVSIAKNAAGCPVIATDINPDATVLARENAARHGANVTVYEGDLFDALPQGAGPFSAIVSNPPYVKDSEWADLSPVITRHEDRRALLAGADGLDCIRRIVSGAAIHLLPGGLLALEIDDSQAEAVAELLRNAGFGTVQFARDLAGHRRIAHGVWV